MRLGAATPITKGTASAYLGKASPNIRFATAADGGVDGVANSKTHPDDRHSLPAPAVAACLGRSKGAIYDPNWPPSVPTDKKPWEHTKRSNEAFVIRRRTDGAFSQTSA